MRAKLRSFFSDLAQCAQTPNLKSARVSEHRSFPANEFMQSAARFDGVDSGSQPQVIRVAEDDWRIEIRRFKFFEANALDCTRGSHRHENRRLDHAATSGEGCGTSFAFRGVQVKL